MPNSFATFSAISSASFELLRGTDRKALPRGGGDKCEIFLPINNSNVRSSLSHRPGISVANPTVTASDDDAFFFIQFVSLEMNVSIEK